MEKFIEALGIEVIFDPTTPLSASEPPVPPVDTKTVELKKGYVHVEGALALTCDITFEQDVAIPLRDGTILYGDIFRPTNEKNVPIILAYTPYCKRDGWWNLNFNATKFGVPQSTLSGLQSFEAPDPAIWCDAGYAVAVVDAAGTSNSGGDEVFMGTASGRNVYDVIEWLGQRDWSNGKVGMAGNSQLGMIQWATAALQPPHLAAIAPWEGLNDSYRDVVMRGGILDTKFHDRDIAAFIFGRNNREALTKMAQRYPLYNAYWEDKRPHLKAITEPAYVVASFTSAIHPRGTLEAFRGIASEHKWLRVHNNQEWLDLADAGSTADLRKFFDRYLKNIDNDWDETPKVRLSILDPGGEDEVNRPETSWPLERQEWRKLYLDAQSFGLSDAPLTSPSVAEYAGDDLTQCVRFSKVFEEETEITGYLNLHLWVEAADADDMDLFAALYKESADGKRLHHITLIGPQARGFVKSLEQDGKLPGTLSYTGPLGRLRVSQRAIDPERSTPSEPLITHRNEERLIPGECVPIELSLWPTSMVIHAGERLVVEIAGHPVGPHAHGTLPGAILDLPTRNRGRHRIRTGERYDSHLLFPVIPSEHAKK